MAIDRLIEGRKAPLLEHLAMGSKRHRFEQQRWIGGEPHEFNAGENCRIADRADAHLEAELITPKDRSYRRESRTRLRLGNTGAR